MPTSHQAMLFKRNYLIDNPYDTCYKYSSDYHTTWDVLKSGSYNIIKSPLITNEPYGSDTRRNIVELEYRLICCKNFPSFLCYLISFIRIKYDYYWNKIE